MQKPLIYRGFAKFGGEGGIRTPGTILLVQRFSKPPHSATLPPLRPIDCQQLTTFLEANQI